jgi:hypothetical protein
MTEGFLFKLYFNSYRVFLKKPKIIPEIRTDNTMM